MLLEEWLKMESGFGELGDVNLVRAKLPKKLKKRRQIDMEDGPAAYVLLLYICLFLTCLIFFIVAGKKQLRRHKIFGWLSPYMLVLRCRKNEFC